MKNNHLQKRVVYYKEVIILNQNEQNTSLACTGGVCVCRSNCINYNNSLYTFYSRPSPGDYCRLLAGFRGNCYSPGSCRNISLPALILCHNRVGSTRASLSCFQHQMKPGKKCLSSAVSRGLRPQQPEQNINTNTSIYSLLLQHHCITLCIFVQIHPLMVVGFIETRRVDETPGSVNTLDPGQNLAFPQRENVIFVNYFFVHHSCSELVTGLLEEIPAM